MRQESDTLSHGQTYNEICKRSCKVDAASSRPTAYDSSRCGSSRHYSTGLGSLLMSHIHADILHGSKMLRIFALQFSRPTRSVQRHGSFPSASTYQSVYFTQKFLILMA